MDSEHQRTDVEVAPNVPVLTSTSKLENVMYIESYSVISILKHIKTSWNLSENGWISNYYILKCMLDMLESTDNA